MSVWPMIWGIIGMSEEIQSAESLLDTLPTEYPALTLGWEAAAWAAKYLIHPDGENAGKQWTFTERQFRFLCLWYELNPDGTFKYQHGVRRLGKGSGKSPFAAVLSLIELLAPVRLARFDDSVIGGCIGKPVAMPWVQLGAATAEQTKNTMSLVRAMINPATAPKLHEDYQIDVGKEKVYTGNNGVLEIISSSARSAEGNRCTFAILDETEHFTPASGGVALFDTVIDNLTKTGSRCVETCNAWIPDRDTVAQGTFEDWQAQYEDPDVPVDILMDIVQAPFDTDLEDEDSVREALRFVYEDCPWSLNALDAIISRIYRSAGSIDSSKRKYLNWPTTAQDAWVSGREWTLLEDKDRVVKDGEEIVMFFDGSLSNDATALIGCCVSDGHIFTIGIWEPGNDHTKTHRINVDVVDGRVDWAFETYDVKAFFADVREWESFTKVEWPKRYRDRLDIWASPSGKIEEPIAWDMRGKDRDFTFACELVEQEIQQGAFTHDGNPVLARHVVNSRREENRYGIRINKESKDSPKKIDAAVCMIGARHALRVYLDNRPKPRSKRAFFL